MIQTRKNKKFVPGSNPIYDVTRQEKEIKERERKNELVVDFLVLNVDVVNDP